MVYDIIKYTATTYMYHTSIMADIVYIEQRRSHPMYKRSSWHIVLWQDARIAFKNLKSI